MILIQFDCWRTNNVDNSINLLESILDSLNKNEQRKINIKDAIHLTASAWAGVTKKRDHELLA